MLYSRNLTPIFLDFRLYDLTQSPSSRVRMQSLRLLVNLSTNEDMVPHLLSARVRDSYGLIGGASIRDVCPDGVLI